MHLAQGRRDELDVGMLRDDSVDQREERVGVELDLDADVGPGDPQPFLQVFLVPDQHIQVAGDLVDKLLPTLGAAGRCPELRPVIQVERCDGTGAFAAAIPSMIKGAVVSDSEAKMPPE